jgi:hypothetical protein
MGYKTSIILHLEKTREVEGWITYGRNGSRFEVVREAKMFFRIKLRKIMKLKGLASIVLRLCWQNIERQDLTGKIFKDKDLVLRF